MPPVPDQNAIQVPANQAQALGPQAPGPQAPGPQAPAPPAAAIVVSLGGFHVEFDILSVPGAQPCMRLQVVILAITTRTCFILLFNSRCSLVNVQRAVIFSPLESRLCSL
jgi:hypothetical protein